MDVIDHIKRIRIEKGVSHEAMAHNLGISQAAYTKIERNETKLSVDRLFKIAKILETNIEKLLGLDSQKVYNQEFKDNATNYQEIKHLHQESQEAYKQIIQSKEEQIILLKEMIELLKK
jgi:transcriptional regulator with XRE-family HTH domain